MVQYIFIHSFTSVMKGNPFRFANVNRVVDVYIAVLDPIIKSGIYPLIMAIIMNIGTRTNCTEHNAGDFSSATTCFFLLVNLYGLG